MTGAVTRRALLAGVGASLAATRVWAAARLTDHLAPRQVASGICMIEGPTECFNVANGGAIVNVMMIETPEGILIVDTGPSRRYAEALRSVARTLHPLGARGDQHPSPPGPFPWQSDLHGPADPGARANRGACVAAWRGICQ
jgi:hypothetical protein